MIHWPWQVGLRRSPSARFPFCGGTLIRDNVVLTAAHCFPSNPSPSSYWVRVGDKDLYTTESQEENIRALRIIRHERYDKPDRHDNDIALIILSRRVTLRNNVHVACLPSTGDPPVPQTNANDRKKAECFITGWGTTRQGGYQSNTLHEAEVTFYSREKCKNVYRNLEEFQLCAGYEDGGVDTCQGDSGGPMVCRKSREDPRTFVVRGVTSYGYGCAQRGKPGVYTSVYYYMDWINSRIVL